MPRIHLSARTRRVHAQLAAAKHHGASTADIEDLQLEFARAKAEDLRAEGERQLAAVDAIVARTRAEQGLPLKVTDAATLGHVADVLRLPDGDQGAT
jgi:hypothetical protein